MAKPLHFESEVDHGLRCVPFFSTAILRVRFFSQRSNAVTYHIFLTPATVVTNRAS
jgi:hypothetical protein